MFIFEVGKNYVCKFVGYFAHCFLKKYVNFFLHFQRTFRKRKRSIVVDMCNYSFSQFKFEKILLFFYTYDRKNLFCMIALLLEPT